MVSPAMAAAAAVTWVMLQIVRREKPTAVGASIGAVVGLVAVTPAAGFVTPLAALAIGSIGAACWRRSRLQRSAKLRAPTCRH